MKDIPLPAIGDKFCHEGTTYVVAGGYAPPPWASGHAKLVLVDFDARAFIHLHVSLDREAGEWRARSVMIKRTFG